MEYIIKSPEQMIDFWKKMSQTYKKILLYGELWAWKTHLIKWFAQWLWLDQNIIQSPTYTYINNYNNILLHIDMYRIKYFDELLEKWIIEQLDNFEYIAIERPKRIEEYIDNNWIQIKIEKINQTTRKILINS